MSALLRAESLAFAFGQRPVLRDVSLSLDAGQLVAVIGPNGSGKSTLLKLLIGHYRGAGRVWWLERDLREWPRRELARVLAYLPQSLLWDPQHRVSDVLRMGRAPWWGAFGLESERDIAAVASAGALLGLGGLLDRRLEELSGGQRQSVFVARCLAQEPRALLLDEPNTFLDLRHQVELLRLLRWLCREKSMGVLMASHDLNLAGAFADRMILLHDGAIIAAGAPTEVLRPELLSRAYGIDMRRMDPPDGGAPVVLPDLRPGAGRG